MPWLRDKMLEKDLNGIKKEPHLDGTL